jgi:hypothetical protein
MAKKIALDLDIKSASAGEAVTRTKTLKQELRELKQELQTMDEASPDFLKIAKAAGEIEDKIKATNEQVAAFASPANERALNGILDISTGIAGGFAAVQGAAALFGSENEDLQKAILKTQAAMSLLNGIIAIQNVLKKESAATTLVMSAAQKTAAAATRLLAFATNGLQKAIIATGIGALVVLVGVLIANFDKVKAAVLGVVDRFNGLGDTTKNVISVLFPLVGIIRLVVAGLEKMGVFQETAADRYEKLEKATKANNEQMERDIKVMEASGASARELYSAKRKLLMQEYELMKAKKESIGLNEEELKAYKNLINDIKVLDAGEVKRQDDLKKENDKKADEERKKRKEEAKKRQQEIDKLIEEERKAATLRLLSEQDREIKMLQMAADEKMKIAKGNADAQKLITQNLEQDINAINEKFRLEREEKEKELRIKKEEEDKKIKEKQLADEKEYAASVVEVYRNIEDSKLQIATMAASFLQEVAGQNKALAMAALVVEKGAAIANVLISTQREIAAYYLAAASRSALSGGTTTAFDQALAAKQALFAKARAGVAIATITASGINGARSIGSGGQAPNAQSGNNFGNVPTGVGSGLDTRAFTQGQTRVYVVENDITRAQRRVAQIRENAIID